MSLSPVVYTKTMEIRSDSDESVTVQCHTGFSMYMKDCFMSSLFVIRESIAFLFQSFRLLRPQLRMNLAREAAMETALQSSTTTAKSSAIQAQRSLDVK